jgi:hypothetical protein
MTSGLEYNLNPVRTLVNIHGALKSLNMKYKYVSRSS